MVNTNYKRSRFCVFRQENVRQFNFIKKTILKLYVRV